MPRTILMLALSIGVSVVGCGDSDVPKPNQDASADSQPVTNQTSVVVALTSLSPDQEKQKRVAIEAKDAMFNKLSGRLMSVIESDGPAKAINVCKSEAPAFGEQTEREFGAEIGRTSFRLRNSTRRHRSHDQFEDG